jgi:hypothetical protein
MVVIVSLLVSTLNGYEQRPVCTTTKTAKDPTTRNNDV